MDWSSYRIYYHQNYKFCFFINNFHRRKIGLFPNELSKKFLLWLFAGGSRKEQ